MLQNEPVAVNSRDNTGPSVTSSEFDNFLLERVREAEHMPTVGSSTTSGQRSDVGPTGQPQSGGELFSL